jgi:hypothetical protein
MYMYLWKLRVHVSHDQRVCLCFTRGLLLFTVYLCFTRGLLFIIVLAVNSKTNNRSWFRKNVLIGQFPSKSVKDFRKIGWVSIPSKFFDKVFDAGLHDHRTLSMKTLAKFLMENFDRVNGLLCFTRGYCFRNNYR